MNVNLYFKRRKRKINLFAQLFGIAATILLFITYQLNSRSKILFCHICLSVCWVIHYGMIGAMSAMVINIICFLRNVIFFVSGQKENEEHSLRSTVIICTAEIVATLFTWADPVDFLALVGAPLQTVALYMKKPVYIRILMLIASPMWLTYDAFNGSYAGIMTEILVMTSIVVSIIRYDLKGKTSTQIS